MSKIKTAALAVLSLSLLSGCVSLPRTFHAQTYRNQMVYIDTHHRYLVGALPIDWVYVPTKKPGILFKNRRNGATLMTEAICGAAFEDLPLSMLQQHLLAGLESLKKEKAVLIPLSDRKALLTEAHAALDGAPVRIYSVILKKNRCQFDFFAISIPEYAKEVAADFITFVKGFDYR